MGCYINVQSHYTLHYTACTRQLITIQPPVSTRSLSYLFLSRSPVASSLKFCNHSLVYIAPALWNGLPKNLRQFAHPPNPPLNFTPSSSCPLLCNIPLTTEVRTLQAILYRLYFLPTT